MVVMSGEFNRDFFASGGGGAISFGRTSTRDIGAGEFGAEVTFVGGGGDAHGVADEFKVSITRSSGQPGGERVAVAQKFGARF